MASDAPLNILILCSKFPYPPKDGGTHAMLNMIRGFHQAGHLVTVLTMNTPKHYLRLNELPEHIKEIASFIAVDVNTDVNFGDLIANYVVSLKSYHVERFTSKQFERQVIDLLEKNTFDIIQLETLFMVPYLKAVKEKGKKAVVSLRLHNIENEIWKRRAANEPNPFKKVYFQTTHLRLKQYEEGTIKAGKYDVLIPITKRDQDSFKKIGNRKPSFFANAGIDFTHIPEPEQQLEYPSLYYLGALDWEPNKEGMRWFIKEVWPRVSRAFPEMPFYLAGRNMPPEFSKMKKKNLIVVGEVEDAYEFIRDKGIMVAPILSGSGMRVKIVEAMAHGKGIVATTQAAEGLATKHGDHLLIGDSPGDFFNHIAILVENRNMYNTLGKHARTLAHKFYNNQDIIENLAGFYQRQIRSKNK